MNSQRLLVSFILLVALGAAACGESMDVPDGATPPNPDGSVDSGIDAGGAPVEDATALLEIHALDIWAQGLPLAGTTLDVTRDGAGEETFGWPVATVVLRDAAAYEVTLSADDHESLTVSVTYDGSTGLDGATVDTGADAVGQGVSVSHDMRVVSGRNLPVHTVYLGLRHRWFSAQGRPARRGNRIDLFTNGEDAWSSVADEIESATDHVHMATWWWESDFELVRPAATHVTSSPAEREPYTILGLLDASPADKRILINRITLDLTTDPDIRARGAVGGDGFEMMRHANTTSGMFFFQVGDFTFQDNVLREWPGAAGRAFESELPIESDVPPRDVDLTEWPVSLDVEIASYHQKFATIDGRVAFVGGMNLRRVDWDTDEHRVFDARRMLFDSTTSERMDVLDRDALPDTGPRKDYMTRIEGPLVQDVEDLFEMRWQERIDAFEEYSENATSFDVIRDQPFLSGGVQAQLTATLPQPFWEHAIAETWFNAIANAEQYILIEDQYFRVPMLVDAIVERMTMVPGLQLVVITKPINEYTDPGCEWTYLTDQDLRTRFPTRYHTYTMRSFDYVEVAISITDETEERFQDMDTHSKMLIVDDVFMSVGSCNKNNRGIVYEGELNVAVLDRTWVTAERRRILGQMLPPGTTVSDTPSEWINQIAEAASWNDYVYENWDLEGGDINLNGAPLPMMYTPSGFLYGLQFRDSSYCLIEGVGPDMT